MSKEFKHFIVSVFSSLLLIGLWYLAALKLDARIILPLPSDVLKSFISLFSQKQFSADIIATLIRAFQSFVLIVSSGALLGILAGVSPFFRAVLSPLVSVFKATPVMSVILLAFIWFKTGTVPVFSAFLMGFPVMYVQTFRGVLQLDEKLNQMCIIYRIKGLRKLHYFIFPSLVPSLITGAKQSLSMIWKVVIAAEVLTLPDSGVGRSLQLAQIQMQTSYVFAWTVVAILLTAAGDLLFDSIIKRSLKNEH